MNRVVSGLALGLLGFSCALAAASPALGAEEKGAPPALTKVSQPVTAHDFAQRTADNIREALSGTEYFSGVHQTTDGDIALYTTANAPSLDLDRWRAHPSVQISVTRVPSGERALLRRTAASHALVDRLLEMGVAVRSYGPDYRTGRIQIAVQDLIPQSVTAIHSLMGADVDVKAVSAEISGPTGRANDSIPWYGGNYTLNGDTDSGNCTSGVSIYSTGNGQGYQMSAGHCYPTGAKVVVGTNGYANAPIGTHTTIGYVTTSSYNTTAHDYMDAAFIPVGAKTNSGAYAWGPPVDTVHPVVGHVRPSPGSRACVSGAYTLERCGTVDQSYYMNCFVYTSGERVCSTWQITPTDGYSLIGKGDSGGPVYVSASNYADPQVGDPVRAAGIGVGGRNSVECFRKPGRLCYRTAIVTDFTAMMSEFNIAARTVP